MMRRLIRRLPMLAALAVLAAACGGEGPSVFRSPETTVAPPPGSTPTTAEPATTVTTPATTPTTPVPSTPVASSSTTTVAGTTTAPESPILIDAELMDGIPAADLPDGPEALMSGAPDEAAAAALRAELDESGVDLTGVEMWVWPVSGTADVLLVIEGDDRASTFVDDPQASDAVLRQMIESEILDAAGVTRVVINYRGADAEGPFTFTATMRLEVIRRSLQEGTDIPQEELLFEFARGT